jgi:hypothetical protein
MAPDELDLLDVSNEVSTSAYEVQDVDPGDLSFRRRGRSGSRVWGNLISRLHSIDFEKGVGIPVSEGDDPIKVRNRVTQAVQNQVVNSLTANERETIRFRVRLTQKMNMVVVSKHKREPKVVESE